uniref:Uncharacterized protein n=1 Tax=Cacopsylla melanoneura TaxID=428564 RepID=A0A8D8QXT9_9HEMI
MFPMLSIPIRLHLWESTLSSRHSASVNSPNISVTMEERRSEKLACVPPISMVLGARRSVSGSMGTGTPCTPPSSPAQTLPSRSTSAPTNPMALYSTSDLLHTDPPWECKTSCLWSCMMGSLYCWLTMEQAPPD